MGRLFCNGKNGYCERVIGTAKECENVSCMDCEFLDGTGAKFIDKITNYDRIRNMSIDELANFIPDWSYTKACKCDEETYVDCNNECCKCVKQWLESEVE